MKLKFIALLSIFVCFLPASVLAQTAPPAAQQPDANADAKRAAVAIKTQLLNRVFGEATAALAAARAAADPDQRTTEFRTAIEKFKQASTIDPKQVAVWNGLGEAYGGLASVLQGAQRTEALDHAAESYHKSLDEQPNQAGVYNQLGNVLGMNHELQASEENLLKAAALDPKLAPTAYFNIGGNLANNDQFDRGANYFKKAVDADNSYAEAWYRYGSMLLRKGTIDPQSGSQIFPDDCRAAFLKYLALEPGGSKVALVNSILSAMDQKLANTYLRLVAVPPPPAMPIEISPPTLVRKVQPTYPLGAKEARISGMVRVQVLISETGDILSVKVISSPSSLLTLPALEALSQWQYTPMTKGGIPVKVVAEADINFTLTR